MKLSREAFYLLVIILLIALCGQFYYSYKYEPAQQRRVDIYYNREIEANRKIIHEIQRADRFVYFAIYTFTRFDIRDALLAAKRRGLDVRGITDKSQLERIDLQRDIVSDLRRADIPISVQDHSAIMHLKTMVTDKSFVSGSFNWTASATDSNDEVLEIGFDESLRQQYEKLIRKLLLKYQPAE